MIIGMDYSFRRFHCTLFGIILICLIGILYGGRVKRNVFEFRDMVSAATSRDPLDFYGYGNYCGLGGHGSIVDPIDLCCKMHDKCYADQKYSHCGIFSPKYAWEMTTRGIICHDPPNDFCRRHLCECDKACAQCFAANNRYYEPTLTRTVHRIAYDIVHFLEPYPPPNPEDFKLLRIPVRDLNVTPNDTVERTRRCHRNDLENVIPFVLLGLLYVTTNPDPTTAAWHFRIFTGFRIFHTFAYLMILPPPSRGIGFLGGFLATVSMAISVLKSTLY